MIRRKCSRFKTKGSGVSWSLCHELFWRDAVLSGPDGLCSYACRLLHWLCLSSCFFWNEVLFFNEEGTGVQKGVDSNKSPSHLILSSCFHPFLAPWKVWQMDEHGPTWPIKWHEKAESNGSRLNDYHSLSPYLAPWQSQIAWRCHLLGTMWMLTLMLSLPRCPRNISCEDLGKNGRVIPRPPSCRTGRRSKVEVGSSWTKDEWWGRHHDKIW